jgi:hypothetical protein
MCLTLLLGAAILLLLVLFAKSALVLLPWTITAAVLAGLCGIGLGRLAGLSRPIGAVLSVVTSIILTLVFGFLGYRLVPPTPPPPKEGLEALVSAPEPTRQDIRDMLPVHLCIVAVVGAMVVARIWYWSPKASKPGWDRSPSQSNTVQNPDPD